MTRCLRSFLITLWLSFLIGWPNAYGQTFETLFSDSFGYRPYADLIQGSDGSFYGTTLSGGPSNNGTVYKVTPTGELTTLASFNGSNGKAPYAGLVEGSDGNFYGTTSGGGVNNQGAVFKVTPAGELTMLVSFDRRNGRDPRGALVEGSDGNFYGTTTEGGMHGGSGTIFKVTPAGKLTSLYSFSFTGNDGVNPMAGLVRGSDGSFYGTTSKGGIGGFGSIFKVTATGVVSTLAFFDGTNGSGPTARLVEGTDGDFYGTTNGGGASDRGVIFKVTPTGVLTRLASFETRMDGRLRSGLVEGSDGSFYGTIPEGSGHVGTIFKITRDGALVPLASLDFTNGRDPQAGLVKGSDGSFYGTTFGQEAMSYRDGTVFKVTPTGVLTVLARFDKSNGAVLLGPLTSGSDGNLYGTSSVFGTGPRSPHGTVFKVTPAGVRTTLVAFNKIAPDLGVVEGDDGNYYGTTRTGGARWHGSIFKVTPEGRFTTVGSFDSTTGTPHGGLVKGKDGSFYGTTRGGPYGLGTIFRMTPAGKLTVLLFFDPKNGETPSGELIEGSDGNFYGTTESVQRSGRGTFFKVTPGGELTTLVSFDYSSSYPIGRLLEGSDGSFYGTKYYGWGSNQGGIYKVTPDGKLTTLVSFHSSNGGNPVTGLVEGNDGNFYGTTSSGGTHKYGTIFKVTPSGTLTTLHSFDRTLAAYPRGSPTFGSDGKLYGTADQMVIWRLSVPMAPSVTTTPSETPGTIDAVLKGTVSANGSDTTVTFEYGLTPEYGSSIAATPGIVTGGRATSVSAKLSGLKPHTTYFYRITASSSGGSTSTPGASFTIANSRPVATNDTFIPAANYLGAISMDVLKNDSDSDGDALTITGVSQGLLGTVATDGAIITYTPGLGFLGRDTFSYTVSDGFDTVTAQVKLRATSPVARILVRAGGEVPGAGQEESGVPAGAVFTRFRVPSVNTAGKLTFTARYGVPGSAGKVSVFAFQPTTFNGTAVAHLEQIAPGTAGAFFSSFKDPLLNEAGDIAFLATLSGGDTTKQNREGIWISPSSATYSSGAQLVARTGAQPPGVPAGAMWRKFTSVALTSTRTTTSGDANQVEGGWLVAFTGWMTGGVGGVDNTNDKGLWIATPGRTVLALREDQVLPIGRTQKRIYSFAALSVLPGAPGQGSGVTSNGGVAVHVFFRDGSQALLRVSQEVPQSDDITIEELSLPGDLIARLDETPATFSLPTQSGSGSATAWVGTLLDKHRFPAIFRRDESDEESLKVIARRGEEAPGIEGASFRAFGSVAVNESGGTLVLAKVAGPGVSSSNDEGLWWARPGENTSSLELLAREGAQPPGVPPDAIWDVFTSLAVAEGQFGPIFTGKLTAGPNGRVGPIGVTNATDQGLWAMDSRGELCLMMREGEEMFVEGSDEPKTLKRFTLLNAVSGSPGQRRSFAGEGQIVLRAVFTDGTQAVVRAQVP